MKGNYDVELGDKFLCVKDYVMDISNELAYKKGETYIVSYVKDNGWFELPSRIWEDHEQYIEKDFCEHFILVNDIAKVEFEEDTEQIKKFVEPMYEGVKEEDGKTNYELDWDFIEGMAKRMSLNKGKYPPYNWKKSMDVEKLKQATFRHMIEIMKGNYDDGSEANGHLKAIALNAMMINYQLNN